MDFIKNLRIFFLRKLKKFHNTSLCYENSKHKIMKNILMSESVCSCVHFKNKIRHLCKEMYNI